jgi:hypothetical protein
MKCLTLALCGIVLNHPVEPLTIPEREHHQYTIKEEKYNFKKSLSFTYKRSNSVYKTRIKSDEVTITWTYTIKQKR